MGEALEFLDMRGNLRLSFFPGCFQAEKGPAVVLRACQRAGNAFPHGGGQGLGLADHQRAPHRE